MSKYASIQNTFSQLSSKRMQCARTTLPLEVLDPINFTAEFNILKNGQPNIVHFGMRGRSQVGRLILASLESP